VSRKYSHDYYPDHDDPFIYSDDLIALNKELLNKTRATPFLISAQVAVETRAYEARIHSDIKQNKVKGRIDDEVWHKEYDDGKSYWIPENRWVHETNLKPEQIDVNLYKVRTSADVYFIRGSYEYIDKLTNTKYSFPFPRPVSRTLYQHLQIDEDKLPDFDKSLLLNKDEIDSFYKNKQDALLPYPYFWNVRWLPKNECKITFYSTLDLEKITRVHVPEITIECLQDTSKIKVPVQLYTDIRKKSPYIKHDEEIMYMKIEEI